jgi:Rps23 Pro-64 3,4-dihydroxylase Tpa1-like proline 4-hydroxylase
MINKQDWFTLAKEFSHQRPFNYVVIDNFFKEDVAKDIANDLPSDYEENVDGKYDNVIEKKRTVQNWLKFKKNVYKAMSYLIGSEFTQHLRILTQQPELVADYGLHGGGIHMHQAGDYLNVHLDYDIHPKMDMKRKLNLIVYMNPNWQESWGGNLGLWSHDEETQQPKDCIESIPPFFNRAVIFDTTQNSWHGVTEGINSPVGEYRKSLATYYLIPTNDTQNKRQKALFTPRKEQKGDAEVMEFIEKRAKL